MNKLLEKLNTKPMTLIVSLPANSAELAKAAIAGGADAVKVHINVEHPEAERKFGSFEQERKNLEAVLKASNVPVGIIPGKKVYASKEEMQALVRMGFDFFDISFNSMPEWMTEVEGITPMADVDEKYTMDKVVGMAAQGVQIIEAAVVPQNGYGQRMVIRDLQHYISIASISGIPVIVPTQREIRTEEVPAIWDTGVKGIELGPIVIGKTAKTVKVVTRSFKDVIDNLREPQ